MGSTRIFATAAAALTIAGCTPLTTTGFDTLAPGSERIEVRVPAWRDGAIAIDGVASGHVRRRATGREEVRDWFGLERAWIERSGHFAFTARGPRVGGEIAGDCVYGRSERQARSGALAIAEPDAPLRLRCSFARDGVALGALALDGGEAAGDDAAFDARVGDVRVGDTLLGIRSLHRVGAGRGFPTDAPAGYAFEGADGSAIGGVDVSGGATRRLSLPTGGPARDAALAAGLALALFWDPGDVD